MPPVWWNDLENHNRKRMRIKQIGLVIRVSICIKVPFDLSYLHPNIEPYEKSIKG